MRNLLIVLLALAWPIFAHAVEERTIQCWSSVAGTVEVVMRAYDDNDNGWPEKWTYTIKGFEKPFSVLRYEDKEDGQFVSATALGREYDNWEEFRMNHPNMCRDAFMAVGVKA